MIGKNANKLLVPPNTTCEERNQEYGCTYTDASGCRIWFNVDRQSNLIMGWTYAGDPQIVGTIGMGIEPRRIKEGGFD
jgi:hypothetical protein